MVDFNYSERESYIAEWNDPQSLRVKKFYLSYFPANSTVEMVDLDNDRTFLKRTRIDEINQHSIFVGAKVIINSRILDVVDYADDRTREKYKDGLTFAMIKPDGMNQLGRILKRILEAGFVICKAKMVKIREHEAKEFLSCEKDNPKMLDIMELLASGPILGMILSKHDAICAFRKLVGPCDPDVARTEEPCTLRAEFGTDEAFNAVHASHSEEQTKQEAEYFFPPRGKTGFRTSMTCSERTTLCVVKPHVIQEGRLGDIIIAITKCDFLVTCLQMFQLSRADATEFYDAYRGVVPDFSDMVDQLSSGPCVALEIATKDMNIDTADMFREFCGPSSPEVAALIRPNSLRARFGQTNSMNAVHVTDMPEDTLLELHFFFTTLND